MHLNPFADKRYLCLAGGGPKGHIYTGALKAINYVCPHFLPQLWGVVGTSVGSLFALMLASRLGVDDIARQVGQICFSSLLELNLAWEQYGLDSGHQLWDLVENFLLEQHGSRDITFQQLWQKTGVRLVVVVTNVSTGLAEYHGRAADSWHLPVLASVVASCSIPILYAPVSIGGTRYVDGGLVDNFAFHTFDMYHTIGLRFDTRGRADVDGLKSYLYRVLSLPVDQLAHEQFRNIPAYYRSHNVISFQMSDSPNLYHSTNVEALNRLGFEQVYSFIERQHVLVNLILGMWVSHSIQRRTHHRTTEPAGCWTAGCWCSHSLPAPVPAVPQ